jgi:hypothetical protein
MGEGSSACWALEVSISMGGSLRKSRPGDENVDDNDEDLQIPAAPKRFVVTEDKSIGGV